MNITIRTVKLEDIDNINVLYKEVDEFHLEKYPELFKKAEQEGRPLEYIKSIIETPYREIFVAECEGEISGIAEVVVTRNQPFPVKVDMKWVVLDNIVVGKKFKGRGIGSMLIDCVIDWAKDWNINRIELKVYEKNSEALSFYEGKGFETLNRTMFLNIK